MHTHKHTHTHTLYLSFECWHQLGSLNFKKEWKRTTAKTKVMSTTLTSFSSYFQRERERGEKSRWTSAVIMIITIDITNGETIMNYFAIKFQQRNFTFDKSAKSQQNSSKVNWNERSDIIKEKMFELRNGKKCIVYLCWANPNASS